ncbi:hypothetical protein [Paenibacillus sp. UNCCL52]|nr:hypothetical protein [Paenibacillus sp. UNCCL52]
MSSRNKSMRPIASSNAAMYLEHWKKEWLDIPFAQLDEGWIKKYN